MGPHRRADTSHRAIARISQYWALTRPRCRKRAQSLGPAGFAWLTAGGLFYTVGIVFYALDTRVTHAHGVWHLFVLAGSATHYIAILIYVL